MRSREVMHGRRRRAADDCVTNRRAHVGLRVRGVRVARAGARSRRRPARVCTIMGHGSLVSYVSRVSCQSRPSTSTHTDRCAYREARAHTRPEGGMFMKDVHEDQNSVMQELLCT